MRYLQLWDTNREAFWALLFGSSGDPSVSAVGKVIGASVLAESARTLQDFDPLIAGLNLVRRRNGHLLNSHFVTLWALLLPGQQQLLPECTQGPYCELLRVVSQAPNEYVAGYTETLLRVILEQPSNLTAEQFLAAGQAARNLLGFAWSHQ